MCLALFMFFYTALPYPNGNLPVQVSASGDTFNIGDYIIVGKYNNMPIVWRYSADDNNGKLLVSNTILSVKRYSSPQKDENYYSSDWTSTNYWSVSTIRQWLNSENDAGNVTWLADNPPKSYETMVDTKDGGVVKGIRIGYEYEEGFLNDKNFSEAERLLFKEVKQWTMLPAEHVDLSENGLYERYSYIKETKMGYGASGRDDGKFIDIYYEIPELPDAYYGAAMQTTDRVFLLDEMQLYSIWENFGDVSCEPFQNIVEDDGVLIQNEYLLRGGFTAWSGVNYRSQVSGGTRPAFYLNEDAIETMTGSGTLEDPYVLNGESANVPETKSVTVTVDNEALEFDVEPVIENDRVLVPMRRIFETLGADVDWDDETKTALASKGETQVKLQIGNSEMQTNGETVLLDAAPILLNDRTLVPIRAVSESLNANVVWDEENRQVVITTK